MGNKLIVYIQPGCGQCEILKDWFNNKGIEFEEKLFDTEAQTEMVMKNIFDDPPFLEVNGEVMSSAEMFEVDGKLKLTVSEFLSQKGTQQTKEVDNK